MKSVAKVPSRPSMCGSLLTVLCVAVGVWARLAFAGSAQEEPETQQGQYAGAASCRECHSRFHSLWNTSRHGKAMQPYTSRLAQDHLTPQTEDITIRGRQYRAHIGPQEGFVRESDQQGKTRDLPILHALGGKNVYYFLTELNRGRLQTLPVAYDVPTQRWYDMAGSGVRHLSDQPDEPYHWTDSPYTFNTSCHGCHVSQLSTNYDLSSDSYSTTWKEPGINCETCHGPAGEHIRKCREAPEGAPTADLRLPVITQKRGYTAHQVSATCSGCHAKMSPITEKYDLGDEFFNHYGLTTLEHPDFYPDGRDLGENYTYTLWRMNPCAKAGKLDCMHCHTSSGRNRFAEPAKANQACLPCHQARVDNAEAHTHHKPSEGSPRCVSCHMPTTRFAAMMRSDHSMRPPMPSASLAFKSPNACNLCHTDKDAAWADKHVREWHEHDYQAGPIRLAMWLESARKDEWQALPEILAYLERKGHDEVYANSLVQLLRNCRDQRKWPVLRTLAAHAPSPLVRASAVDALGDGITPELVPDLAIAARDPFRLVRIRAAAALAPVPKEMLPEADRDHVAKALAEHKASLTARPDDWASHYNLGNYYTSRRELTKAIQSFETSSRLRPDAVPPLVNASLAYNGLGDNAKAEACLRSALEVNPKSAAAHTNLGMLLGELGRVREAEEAFRSALDADPKSAVAAYNLGVILGQDRLSEAVKWCGQAYELRPDEPKYAYTFAYFLKESGNQAGAADVLDKLCRGNPAFPDAYLLLGAIRENQGEAKRAMEVYRRAAENEALPEQVRERFRAHLRALATRQSNQ